MVCRNRADDSENYLKNYVQAHPGRSMYGFSIDSEKPGYLRLCFLNKSTKDGGVVQTWVSPFFHLSLDDVLIFSR
jgi:hypothetical protein